MWPHVPHHQPSRDRGYLQDYLHVALLDPTQHLYGEFLEISSYSSSVAIKGLFKTIFVLSLFLLDIFIESFFKDSLNF